MKILVVMDSFKGSLTSNEANELIKRELLKLMPNGEINTVSLSDGGDGMLDCFREGSESIHCEVSDPLGKRISAEYLIKDDTAYIESAKAIGLTLVPMEERDPLRSSSKGLGELISDALVRGIRKFVIGLGGTATNDGGIGMLSVLGFEFLDEFDKPIELNPIGLNKLKKIRVRNKLKALDECEFTILSDVTNPLTGPNGATFTFGPQKGAELLMLRPMDGALLLFDLKTKEINTAAKASFPSAGAAGGLGYAFKYYLNSNNVSGSSYIIEKKNIEALVESSDVVITGEGKFDETSLQGKAPIAILKLATRHNKKTALICGDITYDLNLFNYQFKLNNPDVDLRINMLKTKENLRKATKKLAKELLKLSK